MTLVTAKESQLFDVADFPPPKAEKLLVLSRYGILTISTFQPGFHVAWGPLPKIPESLKIKGLNGYK